MILGLVKLPQSLENKKLKKTFWIGLSSIRMFGIQKQNFLTLNIKTEPLRIFPRRKGSIFSLITMSKEMLGIIDFMLLMMLRDWYNYLEGKNNLLSSLKFSLKEVHYGQFFGFQILTTGQVMSMTCFRCGCSLLQIEKI